MNDRMNDQMNDQREPGDLDLWMDEDAGPMVRPYALTGGRTAPSNGGMDLLTQIRTKRTADPSQEGEPELGEILRLASSDIALAELAARLTLPVTVTAVLVGDLRDAGKVSVRVPETTQSPSVPVLEMVLDGLHTL